MRAHDATATATATADYPPGTDLSRRRPRLSFELLGCARNGHVLLGTDAAQVSADNRLVVHQLDSDRRLHRCLRSDAWSLLPSPTEPTRQTVLPRDEVALPARGHPVKSRYILRRR